ncbi:hypothetical protein GCM10010965_22380 [Caldalkalibacillus thermarum]|uniref:glycosyltransferase n=1 Tax=Caldalkalibacillus thermarum TaxID=296745 RepID=UPI0016694D02|nr:glycosyltransferase [Caldalkalibacillus thermarum]GGK29043.1 hypothetical protein GCM10010965_22380 [Caldalkalibacillus thermarum]
MTQQAMMQWVMNRVNGQYILDFSSFEGKLGAELAKMEKEVTIWLPPEKFSSFSQFFHENSEAEGRLHVYAGNRTALFYADHYFNTIILNPLEAEVVEQPSLLIQELARLLKPNGRLIMFYPATEALYHEPGRLIRCFSMLAELQHCLYLKGVELKNGYLRAVAIKRYHGQHLLTDEEWRNLLKGHLYEYHEAPWGKEVSLLREENARLRDEVSQLKQEKKALENQLAAIKSSFWWKAAHRLQRWTGGSREPIPGGEQENNTSPSLLHAERNGTAGTPAGSKMTVSSAAKASEPLAGPPLSKGASNPPAGTAPSAMSSTAADQPVATLAEHQEQTLMDQWQRYLGRVREAGAQQWIIMDGSTTYWQHNRYDRTLQLTGALLRQGVPVVLVCDDDGQVLPAYNGSLLFQFPRTIFEKRVHEVLEADPGVKMKLMIFTRPTLSQTRMLHVCKVKGWVTVYDVQQDWEALSCWAGQSVYAQHIEKYLVHHADHIIAVSSPMKQKLQEWGTLAAITVCPNGWELAWCGQQGEQKRDRPAQTKQPVIGYVGLLGKPWFDWELVIRLARSHPEWRFEIIGEDNEKSGDLTPLLPANIKVYAKRDEHHKQRLLSRWSAVFLPFADPLVAAHSDPIPIYEYLANGLPVIKMYGDERGQCPYVYPATNGQEAALQLQKAIDVAVDQALLEDYLKQQSWEKRVTQLLAVTETAQPPIFAQFQSGKKGIAK